MVDDPQMIAAARWVFEALALGVLVAGALALLRTWGGIPTRLPSHFDFRGRPDRWAGRWVLAVVAFAALAGWLGLSHQGGTLRLVAAEPEPDPAGALLLVYVKFLTLLILAYSAWTMVRIGRGERERLNLLVMAAFIAAMMIPAIWFDRR